MGKNNILYTPNGPINRFSEEYQLFLDELYYSLFQNSKFKNNLLASSPRKLDHTPGDDDAKLTTLTRTEYISRLYALRYCLENRILDKNNIMQMMRKVNKELK